MNFIKRMFFVFLFFATLSGCAEIPYQQMSDARQTLKSAYEVGAAKYASEALSEAEILLDRASKDIDDGDYESAKTHAENARNRAAAARDIALHKLKSEKENN